MPRDGSMVYSLPPGTDDFVPNTVIESGKIDSLTADLAQELNNLTNGTNWWTGQFKAADGTVLLPGVTFNSDPDSGWYRIGANNIGLSLNAIKAMDMSTTGVGLLMKGGPTAGGSANALTVTWPIVASALASGQRILFKALSANTGATTLDLNSLGAKAVRKISSGADVALTANDMLAGVFYEAIYDSAANAAAGAWILIRPEIVVASLSAASTTEALTGTDTTKYVTPDALAALWEKGSNVASAGTVSLGEGGFFHITGTTTITDIDFGTAKDGRGAWVVFDGILTLTHNATTLKLPGGANITTAAGDRAHFSQDSSDNIICDVYAKADGTAVVTTSTALTVDSQQPTSDSTTVTSTGFSGCRTVRIGFAFTHSSASATVYDVQARVSGGSWRTVASVTAPADATSSIGGYVIIDNFNQAVGKNAMAVMSISTNVLDDSNANNDFSGAGSSNTPEIMYLSYAEVWDEVRLNSATGSSIEGSTVDQRGRWTVSGQA